MSEVLLAINEEPLKEVFSEAVKRVRFKGREQIGGSLKFSVDYEAHLRGGKIDLVGPSNNHPIYKDGFIEIRELDIVWDSLEFGASIDIPEVCIGGQCIISAFGRCILRAPKLCVFDHNPDISASISLIDILRSELSIGFTPKAVPGEDPDNPQQEQWHIVPRVVWTDFDLIDIADTVSDLIDRLVRRLIDAAFGWLPDWARDIIDAIVGGIVRLIRAILDIWDDVEEWLSHVLRVSIGIWDLFLQILARIFERKIVLMRINNPYTVIKEQPPTPKLPKLPPVRVRINALAPSVEDKEMIVRAAI